MIPKKLVLSGFLSYRDPVELDFTQFELACISGPNGAGKSSLLDAITFALFGQARSRGESLINAHREVKGAEVSLTFGYESNTYRVQRIMPRDKSTILEFHILTSDNKWKALTERTLRETEARIQETLRLDYETFVNASFFLQGKADQFTQQRPADRKRILSSILGLEIWENYRLGAVDKRKVLETEMETLQGRLQEINAELGEEEQRKALLKDLDLRLKSLSETRLAQESSLKELRRQAAAVDQQAKLVATLAAQLQRGDEQSAELRARLAERQAEQQTYAALIGRAKEIEKAFSAWQNLRKELEEWDEIATRFRAQEVRRNAPLTAIETEKARLETELRSLKAEETRLLQEQEQKTALEKEHSFVLLEVKKATKEIAQRENLEAELKTATSTVTKAGAQNPLLRAEMEELKGRIDLITNAQGATCPTCGQELTEEHRKKAIAQLNKEGKERGDKYRDNKAEYDQAREKVATLEKRIEQLKLTEEAMRLNERRGDQLKVSLEELQKLETQWSKERAPRLKEIEKSLKGNNFAAEARTQLAAIDEELKTTGYDAAQHDKVRKQEMDSRAAEAEMRSLEQAQAASKPLDREIKDLDKQVSAQEKDLLQQREAHTEAAAGLASIQAELPDMQSAERAMLDLQQQENQVRQEVGAAQQLVAVLGDLRKRRVDVEAQRQDLAGKVAQYQALERAFGKDGVPAMLIEQALPQIETKANEILGRLSGGDMHISFVTQQRYKDSRRDDMRETLEIQISDGAGVRDYEMFSGGEAFRINFAIRLALSEVLAQRAGARLQTLVIDEGFGSQDEAGRQRLVEAITQVQKDFAKILVITHIDSLKEAFPTRIEVEKGPRGSMARVI
jgi:exonuclease SbcC